MSRLEAKVTLVTGAARGIGAAIASALMREGAYAVLTDIHDSMGEATVRGLGERAG